MGAADISDVTHRMGRTTVSWLDLDPAGFIYLRKDGARRAATAIVITAVSVFHHTPIVKIRLVGVHACDDGTFDGEPQPDDLDTAVLAEWSDPYFDEARRIHQFLMPTLPE